MPKPTIAIVGASNQRRKYGNKAVRAYRSQGFEVFPINPRCATIEGLQAYASLRDVPVDEVDRISMYVPPEVGTELLPDLVAKPAKEVWFNPGSHEPELVEKAAALGLNVVLGCSILDVGVDPNSL